MDVALPYHLPGRSTYRFLPSAGSGQFPSARYGGRLFGAAVEVHVCNESKYPSLTISSRVKQEKLSLDLTKLLPEIDARTELTRVLMLFSESGARA